jgi:1-acyl-sn-glycerol-3-phosphate acyltransferase
MKKNKEIKLPTGKKGLLYKLFKQYVRIAHSVYYRKIYFLGKENIPQDVPLVVVSNHQNSLNDALALVLAINSRGKRKIKAIARSDAFDFPVFGTIFRGLGIMPIFRLMYQGIGSLANNAETFSKAAHELLNNGTIIIYPEAGHQDKRWLGIFSYGYVRIALEAAEQSNFEKEIFVMPSCNHYSDYFNLREDILIQFGKPVSLKPYYDLFKEKRRTAQREANRLIRNIISEMMLDVTDLENYNAIDFLRNTYGIKYAENNGFDPDKLPEKLSSDKQFFKRLNTLKTSGNENEIQKVYDNAVVLANKLKELNIKDDFFDQKPSLAKSVLSGILLILLFPLYLVALISNILVIYPPKLINRKIQDTMLHGTITLILSVLITIPITNIILFFSVWTIVDSILIALASLICLPFLFIFAAVYNKAWNRWKSKARFCSLLKQGKLGELSNIRTYIYETLNNLLLKQERTENII